MPHKYLYICDYPTGSMVDTNLVSLCERGKERFAHLIEIDREALKQADTQMLHNTRITWLFDPGYLKRNVFGRKDRGGYEMHIFPVNDVKHIDLWDQVFVIRRLRIVKITKPKKKKRWQQRPQPANKVLAPGINNEVLKIYSKI